jgi:ankyrin repeat protein
MKNYKRMILILTVLFLPVFLSADDRLHKAAYRGDLSVVKSILKDGVDPDERDSFGGTALHAAMFQPDLEVVKALVRAGLTPYEKAVKEGKTALAEFLSSH